MILQNIKKKFNNKNLFNMAMTHSSYANESLNTLHNNERLEFLGDSVLGFVITNYLYCNFKNNSEGELTKIRSIIVCEDTLYNIAKKIKLGDSLFLSKGEDNNGGRLRKSILADTLESLIGAIFLDQGLIEAETFILCQFSNILRKHIYENIDVDYKTILQEKIQQMSNKTLKYSLVETLGPDHNKKFIIDVLLNNKKIGSGYGTSKKRAEQMAAKQAILSKNL